MSSNQAKYSPEAVRLWGGMERPGLGVREYNKKTASYMYPTIHEDVSASWEMRL